MLINEFKFLGIVVFSILALLFLIFLIFLLQFIRYKSSETRNFLENVKISGNIKNIIPYLKTGDLILTCASVDKVVTKSKATNFFNSRWMFTPDNYSYNHIGMVFVKNGQPYIIESLYKEDSCRQLSSLIKNNYVDGVKINKLDNEFNKKCRDIYGVRFINCSVNQAELNRRIENELQIMANIDFGDFNYVRQIAIGGYAIHDIPRNFWMGTEIYFANDPKDTMFCSEFIAALLQRIGIMKRDMRPRMYFPSYFSGFMDKEMFQPHTYSKIKMYN